MTFFNVKNQKDNQEANQGSGPFSSLLQHLNNYSILGRMSGNVGEGPYLYFKKSKKDKDFNPPLEIQIVDEEKAKDLVCGICLMILNKPKQCKNGHLFCHDCIVQYIQRNPECPSCRCVLNESDLARSLFVERHIRQLSVYCKYHFFFNEESKEFEVDPTGCQELSQYENVDKHENKCQFAFVDCRYSSKCTRLRKKDLEKHEEECPYKPQTCSYCKLAVENQLLEEHISECDMKPINCSKCGVEILRGKLDEHKKTQCPEELIPCSFSEQGCKMTLLRKELEDHISKENVSHLLLLKQYFDDQIQNVKKRYESQLAERDEKIKQLERSLSNSDTKIEWKVKNWSSAKKKAYLQSDKFSFSNCTWFIGFYTDGDNEDSKGYISVYLFIDVSMIPKHLNLTVDFSFKFINHKDPSQMVRKEFKTTFPIKGGQGWGDRKAIRASKLTEESGFLKQDTLHLEASLSLKRVLWNL